MVRDAIIHGVSFEQKVYEDDTWILKMQFNGINLGRLFEADFRYKNGNRGRISFSFCDSRELMYPEIIPVELQKVLSQYNLFLRVVGVESDVLYLKQEVLRRAAVVQNMLNTSDKLKQVLSLQKQCTDRSQVIRQVISSTERNGYNKRTDKGINKEAKRFDTRKGLMSNFKR